jgi:hypothetical protein
MKTELEVTGEKYVQSGDSRTTNAICQTLRDQPMNNRIGSHSVLRHRPEPDINTGLQDTGPHPEDGDGVSPRNVGRF